MESQIRSRILTLPNVSTLSAQVTGLEFGDGVVRAVRYVADGDERVTDADFVVDAMGRASKMSDWVEQADFQRPELHRLRTTSTTRQRSSSVRRTLLSYHSGLRSHGSRTRPRRTGCHWPGRSQSKATSGWSC